MNLTRRCGLALRAPQVANKIVKGIRDEGIRLPESLKRIGVTHGQEADARRKSEGTGPQRVGRHHKSARVCAVSGQARDAVGAKGRIVVVTWQAQGPGEDTLRRTFGAYGKVVSVRVVEGEGEGGGRAFVKLGDEAEAEEGVRGVRGAGGRVGGVRVAVKVV